jgi:hypothetical protein
MAENVAKKKEDGLVDFVLPLTYDPEVDDYPVSCSLNFKRYLIKRGEKVRIPKELAKRFDEIEEAKRRGYKYAQEHSIEVSERKFKEENGLI